MILQLVFDLLLTLLTIIIICGVLIALQFPIVMSSPVTALGFAILITVSLGSVSAKVGTILAPLPIFALILVSIQLYFYPSFSLCVCCINFSAILFFEHVLFNHRIYRTWFGTQNTKMFIIYRTILMSRLYLSVYLCIVLSIKGCSYNASGFMARVGGFGSDFVDYPFQFSHCIE